MRKVKTKVLLNGKATGISVSWDNGQFTLIVTDNGILACGIFDPEILEQFSMAGALCRGTPEKSLKEPEDLLSAKVAEVSPAARKLGIKKGMSGKHALAILTSPANKNGVKALHVT